MIFLDISIGGVPTGRLIVSLAHDVVPKTCHNFTKLVESKKYKNTTFHRIIPNFMIQGGDYENHNGTGGSSIYGGKFDDENFNLKHAKKGVLAMANSGKNTNGSQFYITLANTAHLDNKHVVFGEIVGGLEHLDKMAAVETENDKPIKFEQIKIDECGVVEKEEKGKVVKVKETKRVEKRSRSRSKSRDYSSDSDSDSDSDKKSKHKKHKKKHKKKDKKHDKKHDKKNKKKHKKKSKKSRKSSDSSSSSSSSSEEEVRYNAITGKKIKMKLEGRDDDDEVRERGRRELLAFMNSSY